MKFVKKETQTHDLEVAGNKYPAIFSFKAIIEMEDACGIPHSYTLLRLESDYKEDGTLDDSNPMILRAGIDAKEVTALVYGLLKAGGVEVEFEDLAESIMANEVPGLIKQIKAIIAHQGVEDSKNNQTTTKK